MSQLVYQPLLPTGNRYLQQKWDTASFDMHRRKVISMKPTLDTTPPKTYGHLALKMKKHKLEEDQKMKIQRENIMLTEKISHIMSTTGRINNKNHYEHRSLSSGRRSQELQRITKENQLMLQRLSECQPHYSTKQWHSDWLRTVTLMQNIAIFPRTADRKASSVSRSQELQSDKEPRLRSGDGGSEEQTSTEAPEPRPHCHSDTGTEEKEETGTQPEAAGKSLPSEKADTAESIQTPPTSEEDSSPEKPDTAESIQTPPTSEEDSSPEKADTEESIQTPPTSDEDSSPEKPDTAESIQTPPTSEEDSSPEKADTAESIQTPPTSDGDSSPEKADTAESIQTPPTSEEDSSPEKPDTEESIQTPPTSEEGSSPERSDTSTPRGTPSWKP